MVSDTVESLDGVKEGLGLQEGSLLAIWPMKVVFPGLRGSGNTESNTRRQTIHIGFSIFRSSE